MEQQQSSSRWGAATAFAACCVLAAFLFFLVFGFTALPRATTFWATAVGAAGAGLAAALPVALIALGLFFWVREPMLKNGMGGFLEIVGIGIAGGAVATAAALLFALIRGEADSIPWVLILLPPTAFLFAGGVALYWALLKWSRARRITFYALVFFLLLGFWAVVAGIPA